MHHVLILFSYDRYPSGERPYEKHTDILSEFSNHPDVTFHQAYLADLEYCLEDKTISIFDPRSKKDLSEFDLVVFNKWFMRAQHALSVSVYLDQKGVKYVSREVRHQPPTSKLAEMFQISRADLPYIPTYVAPGDAMARYYDEHFKTEPAILKAAEATQGDLNYLVTSSARISQLIAEHPKAVFMLQRYIENDCDYRYGVMGDQIRYVLKRQRTAEGTHLNNASKGSHVEILPVESLESSTKELVLAAARAVGRSDFAGVDLVFDRKQKPYVLEVNKTPEIQTGFAVPLKSELFTEYIYELLTGR